MKITEQHVPFRHWLIDDTVNARLLRTVAGGLPPPEWDGWVRYDNDSERKRTTREIHRLSNACCRLFWVLASRELIDRLADLAGIEEPLTADGTLHGAGIHCIDRGGFLGPHLDYNRHPRFPLERRLNLILFLNPKWGTWGGALQWYDDLAVHVVNYHVPKFNRAVVWESNELAYHGTGLVECPEGISRNTAAMYYLAPARSTAVRKRALFAPYRQER